MTKLHELARLGQSVWYDNIRRGVLDSGEMQALIDAGVMGVTSNPTIFDKAIAGSADYDGALAEPVAQGKAVAEIYEALALADIGRTADLLRPVYDRTRGVDGYVSLEVSPQLAHDTERTVAEARRLFGALGRPNVMIKVPATPAGLPAITALIGEGINVNVTLIFSLERYHEVMLAHMSGLERLAAAGGDLSKVASVASFFVSRIDTAVDRQLDQLAAAGHAAAESMKARAAVASAKAAYALFRETTSTERWQRLAALGARVQRPLWASTSTKNPAYPDTLYVDPLIGPSTVNTMPPATIDAFQDHGTAALTLETGVEEARSDLARLGELGIDLHAVTEQLLAEGVAAFAQSFESLMASIAAKRERLLAAMPRRSASLGSYRVAVDRALAEMAAERTVERIWAGDHRAWKEDPKEITNRLGWLRSPAAMVEQVPRLKAFAAEVVAAGYTDVLLLGMGGSSLAPEVFGRVFAGQAEGGLHIAVLDSTDPGTVLTLAARLDPARTLFIVSTKSGTTVETLSLFSFFYNWAAKALGRDQAGAHFVAITDPGSKLASLAGRMGFRTIFYGDPDIGGRYSALSPFGLVPAALVGVDLERLLERAAAMAGQCAGGGEVAGENPGAWLGAILAELARAGRDKVTFVASPGLANFGDWAEQLIAESTGKEGKGILPVVGEPLGAPEVYGDDRLFVYLEILGDETHRAAVQALEETGQPVVRLVLRDRYDLGEQFFLWEMATAVAGSRMGINPFDQPNVEAAKVLARGMVDAYARTGALPGDEPAPPTAGALAEFVAQARPGDYLALQAYLEPTAESDAALSALRLRLRDGLKLATTVGYGPRFLHSTGQLHKGDAGKGLFIQFTADDPADVPIPSEAGSEESRITFGVLKMAQALGDKQALQEAGRRVIRFHLGGDAHGNIAILAEDRYSK